MRKSQKRPKGDHRGVQKGNEEVSRDIIGAMKGAGKAQAKANEGDNRDMPRALKGSEKVHPSPLLLVYRLNNDHKSACHLLASWPMKTHRCDRGKLAANAVAPLRASASCSCLTRTDEATQFVEHFH